MKKGPFIADQLFSRRKAFHIFVLVFIVVMIGAGLFSCKKTTTKKVTLIKSLSYISATNGATDTTIYTATYDDQNRFASVTKTTNIPGEPNTVTNYDYQSGIYNTPSVVATITYTSLRTGSYTITYHFNWQGYATGGITNGLYFCGTNYLYFYDAAGYLTTFITTDSCGPDDETAYTYNANGDVVSVARNFRSSVIFGTDTPRFYSIQYSYTYLSGRQWPPGIGTTTKALNSLGPNFLGVDNNQMWAERVVTYNAATPFVNIVTYDYQFDSLDRVRMVSITSDSGNIASTVALTYLDQ